MLPKIITPNSPRRFPLQKFLTRLESEKQGVYEFSDHKRRWFYIGGSRNPAQRILGHITSMRSGRTSDSLVRFWQDVLKEDETRLYCRILQVCDGNFQVCEADPHCGYVSLEYIEKHCELKSKTLRRLLKKGWSVPPETIKVDVDLRYYPRREIDFHKLMELKYCYFLSPNLNEMPAVYRTGYGYHWTLTDEFLAKRAETYRSRQISKGLSAG